MRVIEVLDNVKKFPFDIMNYSMCQAEADVVISALEKEIPFNDEGKCRCGCQITDGNYCVLCGQRWKHG